MGHGHLTGDTTATCTDIGLLPLETPTGRCPLVLLYSSCCFLASNAWNEAPFGSAGHLWTSHYTRLTWKLTISTFSHSAIKRKMLHQNHNPQYLLPLDYDIQEVTPFRMKDKETGSPAHPLHLLLDVPILYPSVNREHSFNWPCEVPLHLSGTQLQLSPSECSRQFDIKKPMQTAFTLAL